MSKQSRSTVAIAVFLFAVTLSGCRLSPEKTVEEFLDGFRAADTVKMRNCVLDEGGWKIDSLYEEYQGAAEMELARTILSKLTYSIQRPTMDRNTATVPVRLTSVDLLTLFADLMEEYYRAAYAYAYGEWNDEPVGDLYTRITINAMNGLDVPMTTTNVEFSLTKKGGKWLIVLDDRLCFSLGYAIIGNLGSLYGY